MATQNFNLKLVAKGGSPQTLLITVRHNVQQTKKLQNFSAKFKNGAKARIIINECGTIKTKQEVNTKAKNKQKTNKTSSRLH